MQHREGAGPRISPLVVGWNEYVALPDWGIRRIRAKVDTGAKSSALHVENLRPDGERRVRFDAICWKSGGRSRRVAVRADLTRSARVRSSSGHDAERYFTRVTLVIGPFTRTIELSLVDREEMVFRMLLGRTALRGLLIDPARSRLLGPR